MTRSVLVRQKRASMERVVDDSFFKFKKPLSPANPGNEKTSRLNLSISTCSLTVFFFRVGEYCSTYSVEDEFS